MTETVSADPLVSEAPPQRWTWLRPLLPKRLQPYLRGLRKRQKWRTWGRLKGPFRTIYPFTQVNGTRQRNLFRLCQELDQQKLEGDIVECGVLDGGTAALMGYATAGSNRRIHLFDAWEGLPQPSARDGAQAQSWEGQVVGSPARVSKVMRKLNVAPTRVVVYRGWFHETFPKTDIQRIALLHVDADFYEGTKLCLEQWYSKVVPGGYVQIDDYDSFRGCRAAVDEFVTTNPEIKLEFFGEYVKARACFIRKEK